MGNGPDGVLAPFKIPFSASPSPLYPVEEAHEKVLSPVPSYGSNDSGKNNSKGGFPALHLLLDDASFPFLVPHNC